MGWQWLTRKGNYILKSNLPIGVQNMTLKSIQWDLVNTDYQKNSTELKLKGKRSTRRPRPRWDDQLKRDLERRGTSWEEVIKE